MSYGRAANQLGLVLDGGTTWDTTQMGSSKRLENKNCAIDAVHSSVNGSGNEFTLNLALRFKPAFAGRKSVETMVIDQSQLTTGWQRWATGMFREGATRCAFFRNCVTEL